MYIQKPCQISYLIHILSHHHWKEKHEIDIFHIREEYENFLTLPRLQNYIHSEHCDQNEDFDESPKFLIQYNNLG